MDVSINTELVCLCHFDFNMYRFADLPFSPQSNKPRMLILCGSAFVDLIQTSLLYRFAVFGFFSEKSPSQVDGYKPDVTGGQLPVDGWNYTLDENVTFSCKEEKLELCMIDLVLS